MEGKYRGRKPRYWHIEPTENLHEKEREDGVKQNGDDVIRQRPAVPKFVFQPKNCVEHGIVLRRGGRIGPDSRQTMERTQLGRCEVDIVIPDRLSIPSRLINQERRN